MDSAKDKLRFWRPWPLKQLEILQGTELTNPCCHQFAQSYVIGTVQSGKGILQYHNKGQEITKGVCYIIEPEEIWSCRSEMLTFTHLLVDPPLLEHTVREIIGTEKPHLHFLDSGLHDTQLGMFFQNFYTRLTLPSSRLEQQEILLDVVTQLLLSHSRERIKSEHSEWEHKPIQRVKAYLREHYADDVSLEELTSIAHMSAFHMARLFRQVVGLPPHAYLVQLRIAHARKMLAQGFPVSYVASETGFFDQTHFTHQFKRHVGITPGAYRKTARFY
jgi:AraC-like DNA-binding protein